MKIVFCCTGTKPEPWIDGLRAALPGAKVAVWEPGAPAADYAVVWAPPQTLLDQQPQLKALFNIGAGVDGLLKLRLPPQALVVRLDDAGMSVQMAEYVCHAVIRHFREFDGYEADVKQGRWSYRKPRIRAEYPIGVMGLGVLGSRVAQALRLFDFPVNGWSRTPKALEGVRSYAGAARFDEFLSASRVLVNLLPLTPDTHDILCRDSLSRLLPGGYVDQRGARRAPGRCGPARAAGRRASGRRHARRVPHRATAGRSPVLDAPQDHRHAAHLGAHAAR